MKTKQKIQKGRRNFIKVTAAAGGGMLIGFNWLGCAPDKMPEEIAKAIPSAWYELDAFIKIGDTGLVTIMSPNPEIGQNVKTSMPMIIAEELDVAWRDVVVEQAPLNTEWYTRQVAGGSQSIRQGWESLRKAGATARAMLVGAAADKWGVDASTCQVSKGVISHPDGQSIGYGEIAQAASEREIPEDVPLKSVSDFTIIGKSQQNVDMDDIITGKPLFGIDFRRDGMVYAAAVRPPGFGQILKNFDDTRAKAIPGVIDVFRFADNKIAVLANDTWTAFKGAKAIEANYEQAEKAEDSDYHSKILREHLTKKADEPRRVDGNVDAAFAAADRIIEKEFEAPFIPHNCLEPMNFFAHITEDKAECIGPIQTPQWTQSRIAKLLDRQPEDITINMTRMGGGFGRRLYGDFALEAAEISKIAKKPIKLTFTREDDMLAGIYRPASAYRFKVGVKDNQITAYHLTESCFNGSMFGQMPSNFPCGAIENYRVDSHDIASNVTTGAWRAPYANFLAYAEQAFLDELAQELGQDPVQLRLDLLNKAKNNPVGEEHNYEADKFIGVINLAAEKSNWSQPASGVFRGFSAYYSHNTYVAEVAEVVLKNNVPVVQKIICAVDCGIVVNPKAAINQIEGGIVDGIGHAMYGNMTFKSGEPQSSNFHQFRLIKMAETPAIEVYFVESNNDPTGLGEPTLPPAGGAVANALAAATGERIYRQPFANVDKLLG